MTKATHRIGHFLYPGKSQAFRRKMFRQTIAGALLGLLLAVLIGVLLYFLNLQGRLS
jgi:high-affinity Fe2+/Pb2+ permease